jgi:hypothetical protein
MAGEVGQRCTRCTVPWRTQVYLTSKQGSGVAGRVVVAFAAQSPFMGKPLAELHDVQGQRVATLTHVLSAPSDEHGVATFAELTITGTSSPFVHISFYCEGAWAGLGWEGCAGWSCVSRGCGGA